MFTLAVPQFVIGLLVVLFVIVSVMMMLVVLIQRPQGGGLSEAFGSSSGSNASAFGAKTGDALTTATIIIFLLFIGFAIGLNYLVKPPQAGAPVAAAVQGAEGDPVGVTATSTDESGLPAAPVKLERLDGPPPGFSGNPAADVPVSEQAPALPQPTPTPAPQGEPAPVEPATTPPAPANPQR